MGICGRANIRPAAPVSIDRALSALSIKQTRSHDLWWGDGATLGATDEAILAGEGSVLGVAFDGRIDNRAELGAWLNLPDAAGRSNAALALAAFHRWGEDFCDRILGDWACAVWDGATRNLVMATDPGGLRTLFYWLGNGEILFASEPRGLWAEPEVPKVLDEEQIAAWLVLMPREPQQSLFRDILRVPPGRRVVWRDGRSRMERWWRPEEVPVLRLASDTDYEAAVRDSLDQAVRRRLADGRKTGLRLSGGLDSTAVAAFAAPALAEQGQRLTAFTAAPDHPAPAERNRFLDEWPYAAKAAALYPNIDHVRISNTDAPLFDALAWREAGSDFPVLNPSNTVWLNGVDRSARDRRLEVMLVGAMGNMTISYNGNELFSSMVRRGDLFGAMSLALALKGEGRTWLGLLGHVADAVLPTPVRRALRAAVGKPEVELHDFSPINPDLLRRTGLEDRAREVAGDMKNLALGDSRALRLAVHERGDTRGTWATGTRRLFGLDMRDPTGDRQLFELCLSIPDEQFIKGGVPRSLIRRAMKGLVPDEILNERKKGLQAADWRVGMDQAMPSLREEIARLRNSPLAQRCLDLDKLEALAERWPGLNDTSSRTRIAYLTAFSRGLSAGTFIRRIEGGNA